MPRVKTESMVGKEYGFLTVLKIDHWKQIKTGKRAYVRCKCRCGNEIVVCAYALTQGGTKSCGCYSKTRTSALFKTHGLSNTRIYRIFHDMHRRCEDESRDSYSIYGARGITVCPEWSGKDGFIRFYEWSMENGYEDRLSIDRIDSNGNYSPDNCRWADDITQANNTRCNKHITCAGETHTIAEWGRITGIKSSNISERLHYGWSIEEALGYMEHKLVRRDEVLYTINGETHSVAEWCRIRGISKNTVRYRRDKGWMPEEIFGFKERTNG